jgi:hypothetical protein
MSCRIVISLLTTTTLFGVAGCSTSSDDSAFEETLAAIQDEIPGRERASVRVCEELFNMPKPMSTSEEVLAYVTWGLQEIDNSNDPRGMRNALLTALVNSGDAVMLGDPAAYQSAAINVATVCTDIVSGEYGK